MMLDRKTAMIQAELDLQIFESACFIVAFDKRHCTPKAKARVSERDYTHLRAALLKRLTQSYLQEEK